MLEKINELRERVYKYRQEKIFRNTNSAILYTVDAVELAIIYTELGIVRDREISDEEKHWFEGYRFIDDVFGGDDIWSDIVLKYEEIVNFVKNKNYFR